MKPLVTLVQARLAAGIVNFSVSSPTISTVTVTSELPERLLSSLSIVIGYFSVKVDEKSVRSMVATVIWLSPARMAESPATVTEAGSRVTFVFSAFAPAP